VLFHKLINTCVENFMRQKYFPANSARLLLREKLSQRLTCEMAVIKLNLGTK